MEEKTKTEIKKEEKQREKAEQKNQREADRAFDDLVKRAREKGALVGEVYMDNKSL